MREPLRVLIVEDEALILMQLEELVEDAGHRVVGTAMRSAEAINLAREIEPDLAFVDLSLCDGESGLVVAEALKGVTVVFITANPIRLGSDIAGAAGVIAKPFTRAVLASGMRYLEACIRRPPPVGLPPPGMKLSPRLMVS